ncbi:beta-hexosaminidase subunit alpha [Dendroctonus ponderosae]|uniref:beta-hexosaminidase subunit alpha n=1 Tax=Dendroctonus ponderosae TaxID=77166 RepID=UPI0020359390|nr:beta-hexosaminidase subunit alpha [Dendroctonus ponderosae]
MVLQTPKNHVFLKISPRMCDKHSTPLSCILASSNRLVQVVQHTTKTVKMEKLRLASIFLCLCSVSTYAGRAGPAILASKGAIWPKPQLQNVSEDYFVLLPRAFAFKASNSCSFLTSALERYWDLLQQNSARLNQKLAKFSEQTGGFLGYLGELEVNLRGACVDDEYPSLSMDESYELWVTASRAELQSETIWGVLRGLETFSQLIYLGEDGLTLRLNATTIEDFPRFKHRGLLLDTSRHFLPLESILQTLDALAYNKMNVFHWHIVDDESFPYVSQRFPELSRLGAYNPHTKVYTPENIQTVIEYARLRGIRVLPEFDTPGHTSSWGLAHPELLTPCDQLKTSGPMDPSREETFEFLQSLFSELRGVFKDEFIHLGGDEVDFSCWRQSENISNLMKDLNISSYEGVESYYVQKVVDMAEGLDYKQIVWEEVFSNGVHLGNHTLVHVWKSWTDTIKEVTSAGKQALLSACWYLDQLASGGDWTDFYLCDPMDFDGTPEQQERVLGGEACMWGEVVNEYNVISRTWPRASATAEKLWSAPSGTYKLDEPSSRLEEHTCRMNRRGIGAQPPNGAGFCD